MNSTHWAKTDCFKRNKKHRNSGISSWVALNTDGWIVVLSASRIGGGEALKACQHITIKLLSEFLGLSIIHLWYICKIAEWFDCLWFTFITFKHCSSPCRKLNLNDFCCHIILCQALQGIVGKLKTCRYNMLFYCDELAQIFGPRDK